MSFLGYIGKSLGAGTAPIVNANAASQSDIQYREFRDNAPNREELIRMEMQKKRDEEAERVRGLAERKRIRAAGLLTPNMGVTPTISETAPTTLQPAPAGLPTTAPAPTPSGGQLQFGPTKFPLEPSGMAVDIGKGLERLRDMDPAKVKATVEARLAEVKRLRARYAMRDTGGDPATLTRLREEEATLERMLREQIPQLELNKLDPAALQVRLDEVNRAISSAPVRDRNKLQVERNTLVQQLGALKARGPTSTQGKQTSLPTPPAAGLTGAPAATPAAAATPPAAVTAATPAAAAAPAAGGPVDLRPTGASLAPALAGYEQFRPAVETVAPQLGFGLDEANTLMAGLGYGESRFNAGAKSPSGTFTGAYQLGPAIVSQYGARVQQRFGYSPTSPEGQAAMALMLAADNKKTLVAKGIEPTLPNLALAHNQGAAGAAALLQNPSMPVAEALDKFAPEKNSGSKRASGQAWMKGQDVTKTTAGEFVERASAYYGKYSPEFSNVKSSPINPDVYRGDPDGLTFDMQQAEFMFNLAEQQRDNYISLADASDPVAFQDNMNKAYELTQRLVEQSGVYAQLQITKGLTSAYGGDTSYLNGVLSSVMDYPIEVTAEAGEQGIAYRVTAGGQPVSDSLSYDQMKQFTMRIADSQYDAELTALEVAAAAKANEITMQLNADVYKLLAQGKVNLGLAEYKAEADAVLAELNAKLEAQGQGVELVKLATDPNGRDLVTDSLGRVYIVTTRQQKIGGKMQDITSLELTDVEGLSE